MADLNEKSLAAALVQMRDPRRKVVRSPTRILVHPDMVLACGDGRWEEGDRRIQGAAMRANAGAPATDEDLETLERARAWTAVAHQEGPST